MDKRQATQFFGQTEQVGQNLLHSRAILAYYKEKWDKFCQFCEKLRKFRGKFRFFGKICVMFRQILVCPKIFFDP
jgi:hypothetical protein